MINRRKKITICRRARVWTVGLKRVRCFYFLRKTREVSFCRGYPERREKNRVSGQLLGSLGGGEAADGDGAVTVNNLLSHLPPSPPSLSSSLRPSISRLAHHSYVLVHFIHFILLTFPTQCFVTSRVGVLDYYCRGGEARGGGSIIINTE